MSRTSALLAIFLLSLLSWTVPASAVVVTVHVFCCAYSINPAGQPIVAPTINAGDTIHWVWDEAFPQHSVTSLAGSSEVFDSGLHASGFTFDHTFNTAGTYGYFCLLHGTDNGNGTAVGMWGTVTVNGSAAATSLTVPAVNGSVGQTVNLKATLKSGGTGVSGKSIAIKVDGVAAPGSPVTTNGSGVATLGYQLAEGTVGSHTISASFAGDASFAGSTGSGTLTTAKSDTSLFVPDISKYPGGSVTLSATLSRNSDGGLLSGKTVSFDVGGVAVGSATTNASGIATKNYTVPSGTPAPSTLAIAATYGGDANYNAKTGNSSLIVLKKTTLSVTNASGSFGSTTNLKATLKSAGVALSGATVEFFVDGASVGTHATDASGFALLPHTISESVGTHVLQASFAGDSSNAAVTSANATLTSTKITTALAVSNVTATPGATVNLKATLKAGTTVLSGKTVEFLIGSTSAGSASTNASGVASVPHTATEAIGSYTLTAKFAGDSLYAASTKNATLTVKKGDTKTTPSVLSGKPGQTVLLKATVKSGTVPVVGVTVTFKLDGVTVGTGTTSSTGLATLSQKLPEGVGSAHTIGGEFAGDSNFNASSGSAALTLQQATTKLVGENLTKTAGSSVNLGATLTRTTDNGTLSGKTVSFFDAAGTTLIGTGTTDASGRASITVTAPAIGVIVKYVVKFAADVNYLAASGSASVKGS